MEIKMVWGGVVVGRTRFLAALGMTAGEGAWPLALPGRARFLALLGMTAGVGAWPLRYRGHLDFLLTLENEGRSRRQMLERIRFLAPLRNDSGGEENDSGGEDYDVGPTGKTGFLAALGMTAGEGRKAGVGMEWQGESAERNDEYGESKRT